MKLCHAKFVIAAVLLGTIAASAAHAGGGHRGGGHFFAPFDPRVLIGAALLAPFLYAPPPAYGQYPAPVAVPPPVYVQPYRYVPPYPYVQPYPIEAIPQPPQYWYYCASAKLYHPYAQACPEGWQQIPRQPLF